MDPLSDIVSLLQPHDTVAAGLVAGGDWSIRFDAHAGLKCNAIVKGTCRLAAEGADPVDLSAGDCVILPHGKPFVLSSGSKRLPADAQAIYGPARHGGTARFGDGDDFFMTGARFLLSGPNAESLLATLPPVLILRAGSRQEAIRWVLDRLAQELRNPGPGGSLSITHLSHFLLIQVMRSHLVTASPEKTGWLAALSDPKIMPAIAAIHGEPARAWTVGELASRTAQSRTSFAVRFRRVVGQSPIEYLTQWRMLLAIARLRQSGRTVAEVAGEVGYASESAFTAAFRRTMGTAPRAYLRREKSATRAA